MKTWLAPMVWPRWVLAAMASTRSRQVRGVGAGVACWTAW